MTMSISDVIKSSVYNRFVGGTGLSFRAVLLILVASCLVGVYIYLVYKFFSKSEFYSRDLNVTIAGMSVIVSAIMIAMQSNLLVSLGMVGALSIVRFRTAIKSPIDLLYLFWSISAGIICGVGLYVLGIVLCVIMTLLIFILGKIPNAKAPQLLIVRSSMEADTEQVRKTVGELSRYSKTKSTIVKNGEREDIIEIRITDKNELIDRLYRIPGVKTINVLEHQGEIRV